MSGAEFCSYERIPAAVIVVDRGGSIVFANARADRLFGYEHGELTDLTIDSLIPEVSRNQHVNLAQDLFAEFAAVPTGTCREFRASGKDGRDLRVEIAIDALDGNSPFVAVVRDVTALARMRDQLRDSEQRFRLAAQHTADTLQYINVQENLYVWYTDVDRMLGYRTGEFPRTVDGWLELIHPDDIVRVKSIVERIVENGEPGWDFRYRIRAKDGSYRYWLDRGTVTGFIDGRANEGIGTIVDETEQVLARQKLEHALGEVEQLKDRLQAETRYLMEEIKSSHDFEDIVGNSAPMMATLYKVEQVAATDASVLLLGETGTGKELLARAIHARSRRNGRPLIKVDCTTLPPGLIESELFGHHKGAFTGAHHSKPGRFELADGGTVFLDEIGELPLDLQSKLLRVIQNGKFQRLGGQRAQHADVRVIAATNRDLQAEVLKGQFRSDLYYRIGVFPIEIPPLRDRLEDLPLLTSYFVSQLSKKLGKNVVRISRTTIDTLMSYDWPGNVRELQNVIERALILSPGRELDLRDPLGHAARRLREAAGSLAQDLRGIERARILEALEASHWKIKGEGNAANRLGLKPSTLRTRMKRLAIERPN